MAQGCKYSDIKREEALAMLTTSTVKEVSKKLKVPERTLRDWLNKENEINPEFAEVRSKKKQEFAEKAWDIIGKANKLLEMKIDRALVIEEDLEEILEKAKSIEGLTKDDIATLFKDINKLGTDNIGQLSTMIGTLYDKQALINKEATIGLGADKSLEEVLKNLQGEEM